MPKHTLFLLVSVATVCAVSVSGCSLVGFVAGAIVDSVVHDSTWVEGSSVLRVERLDSTSVRMKDGTLLSGSSLQTVHLPGRMYESLYAQALETGNLSLPGLYDTVDVIRTRGIAAQRTVSAPFFGFGIDSLTKGAAIKLMLDSEMRAVALTTVETIEDREGRVWEGRVLNGQTGELPFDRAMHLTAATGDTVLPVNTIDSVLVLRESGWRWVGLGAGAVVDVVAIWALSTLDLRWEAH